MQGLLSKKLQCFILQPHLILLVDLAFLIKSDIYQKLPNKGTDRAG